MNTYYILSFTVLSFLTRCHASMFDYDWLMASTKPYSSAVVDCELRTAVFNEGNAQHTIQRRCITHEDNQGNASNEMIYDIPQWLADKYKTEFDSRPDSYLHIDGGHLSSRHGNKKRLRASDQGLSEDRIVVDKNAKVQFSDTPFKRSGNHRRSLAEKTGSSSVLIVRVTTNDAVVDQQASTLSDFVFGSYGTPASQFQACSMGKKQLEPVVGPEIIGGVLDLFVNADITGVDVKDFENNVNGALTKKIDSLDAIDHIIYCLPPGANGPRGNTNWKAYAYVYWNRSFYNHGECAYLSTLVHELGHNMGLGHSGEGDQSYADQSGIMGYGYNKEYWPLMCFNGAKNWQLGWYSEKAVEVSDYLTSGAWKGRLYGFVDFAYVPNYGNVLIKVGDIHIQYNRVAEMNQDTLEKKNLVAFTKSTGGINSKSLALAGYASGTWSHGDLRVDICSHHSENGLNYFDVVVRSQSQNSICSGAYTTSAPTIAPTTLALTTLPPTVAPTVTITLSPITAQPSSTPTAMPSGAPTKSPTTVIPTDEPTTTLAPSSGPSQDLICDDSPYGEFPYVDPEGLVHLKTCTWLAARANIQKELCVSDHLAWDLCEETCGKCTDDCHDTDGTFEHNGVQRPCSWLSIRLFLVEEICTTDHPSYSVCPETCGGCDVPLSLNEDELLTSDP